VVAILVAIGANAALSCGRKKREHATS